MAIISGKNEGLSMRGVRDGEPTIENPLPAAN
jgi:hypothetical protein